MAVRTLGIAVAALLSAAAPLGAAPIYYTQTNLTSDVMGLAANTDDALVNPWGIAASPTSPFWIADNGTGMSTVYNGAGVPQPATPLTVTIPDGRPTGAVFNPTSDFKNLTTPAQSLFATEDGVIALWEPSLGANAIKMVDQSAGGTSYTGLAIGAVGGESRLYAADFAGGKIDVYDGTFTQQFFISFNDPNLPAGYAPFNVQNLDGVIYVTYASQTGGDLTTGAGLGIVDAFAPDGSLLRRVSSGGALDAPWGLALAPAGFGDLGGSLLVGNFGDGRINAFDPLTGMLLTTLADIDGDAIVNDGLWGLAFGNGGPQFDPLALYFTAGIQDETHGLFGAITASESVVTPAAPEPATLLLVCSGIAAAVARRHRRLSR